MRITATLALFLLLAGCAKPKPSGRFTFGSPANTWPPPTPLQGTSWYAIYLNQNFEQIIVVFPSGARATVTRAELKRRAR